MQLSVRTNIDQVFADLDQWADGAERAIPRAVNKLIAQAETAGLRKISEVYQIGPRTMEQYVTIKLTSTVELEASITAKGIGFPLSAFNPRQTNAGVSVSIKGRRVIVPHAFIATLRSGHVGVFARGAYAGKGRGFKPSGEAFGRFLFGKARLPINELFTFAPPDALANDEVIAAMEDRVNEQADNVVAHELSFAAKGG